MLSLKVLHILLAEEYMGKVVTYKSFKNNEEL